MSKHKKIEYHVPATETANISSDQTAVEELNSYNEADSTMFSLNDVKSHFSELKSTLPHSVKSRSRQLNLDFDQWMLHLKTVGQFRYSRTELLNILGTFLDSAAEDCSLLANKSGKVLHLIKDELEERSALLEQAYLALCNLPCPLSHMNEHRRMKLLEHVVVEEDLVAKKIDKLKEHCENTILSEAVERYQQDCCNYFNQVRELINKNYSIDQIALNMKQSKERLEFNFECIATDYFIYSTKKAQLKEYNDANFYWSTNELMREMLDQDNNP